MARRGPFDDISDLSRLTHAPPAEQLFADPRGIELAQRKYDSTADEFCTLPFYLMPSFHVYGYGLC